MTTIRAILTAAAQTARTADDLSRSFARELAAVLRNTERRLGPMLTEAAAGSRTAIIRAVQANRTRRQIRDVLTEAGFDELAASATDAPLDRMVRTVLAGRRAAELAGELTPSLEKRIAALQALMQVDVLDEGEQAARALWKATVRGIFGARPAGDILADLGKVLDRSEAQIATLYDTSISVFGRQVEALQAGSDPETKFAFVGPVDDRMRPWCRAHVGKIYARAQIDALDNGQLNDVFLTGGGYNCRHTWMEVSKFSELQDYGPHQRIPEVQQDLEQLKEAA